MMSRQSGFTTAFGVVAAIAIGWFIAGCGDRPADTISLSYSIFFPPSHI